MSKIVDFNKAKEASNRKKNEKEKKKKKTEKLIQKYRRIDKGHNNRTLYFYIALLFAVTIFVLLRIF